MTTLFSMQAVQLSMLAALKTRKLVPGSPSLKAVSHPAVQEIYQHLSQMLTSPLSLPGIPSLILRNNQQQLWLMMNRFRIVPKPQKRMFRSNLRLSQHRRNISGSPRGDRRLSGDPGLHAILPVLQDRLP